MGPSKAQNLAATIDSDLTILADLSAPDHDRKRALVGLLLHKDSPHLEQRLQEMCLANQAETITGLGAAARAEYKKLGADERQEVQPELDAFNRSVRLAQTLNGQAFGMARANGVIAESRGISNRMLTANAQLLSGSQIDDSRIPQEVRAKIDGKRKELAASIAEINSSLGDGTQGRSSPTQSPADKSNQRQAQTIKRLDDLYKTGSIGI